MLWLVMVTASHAMHHTIKMQQASPCLQQVCVQMAAAATYAPSTSSICHTPANCEPRARLKMHFLDGLEGQTSRSGGRTRVKLLQSSEAGRARGRCPRCCMQPLCSGYGCQRWASCRGADACSLYAGCSGCWDVLWRCAPARALIGTGRRPRPQQAPRSSSGLHYRQPVYLAQQADRRLPCSSSRSCQQHAHHGDSHVDGAAAATCAAGAGAGGCARPAAAGGGAGGW